MRLTTRVSLILLCIIAGFAACNTTVTDDEHHNSTVNTGQASLTPLEQAHNYAMATQAVLGKNLLNAIGTKGTAGAVAFCNTRALPLTDSMAAAQGVTIRRVSDKPRNPNNMASEPFRKYIDMYKQQLAKGEELKPNSMTIAGKEVYFIPIVTNAMCLKCHGTSEINSDVRSKLKTLYPSDRATGYSENQVRGMWVVHRL
jgi:hypothetical protein